MGLYLQTGMNLWTAFGVGLGASIFTIGLPCLGTFLIWGYKDKEKVEKKGVVEKKEATNDAQNDIPKNTLKFYLIIFSITLFSAFVILTIVCIIKKLA